MTTAFDKALTRSRENLSIARSSALIMKKAGTLSNFLDMGPASGLTAMSQFQDQGANRQRYAKFRGWVYAAVNALAAEGAGQPLHVGKMKGTTGKKTPKGSKETIFIAGGREFTSRKAQDYEIRKMPSCLMTKAAKNELEVFNDHPLLEILNKPNPIQYGWQFVYSFIANLCLTGWGFVIGGTNDDGDLELYSLPTTWIYPDHSKGAFAEFRIVNPNNPTKGMDEKPLTRDQVAFAYLPNPADPLLALAPAQAQGLAVKIDEQIQSSQAMFFENAVFPSAIVTIGKNPHPEVPGGIRPRLTAAQRRQIYGAIKKVSAGVANYGNPAIIDGMIESIERWSADQNEIGWEKSEPRVRSRILSAFSVHPFILGEEVAGSYAQAYVVKDRFYSRVNVFLSMLSTIITDFAPPLLKDTSNEKLLVWWEQLKAVDPSMEKSLWEGARGREDVSQNEFRGYMNLPPDEDSNEAQIDKSSLQAVAGIAAQVKSGALDPEQGQAILEGLGLPKELAQKIAGEGPSEEDLGGSGLGEGFGQPGAAPQGGEGDQGGDEFDAATQELSDAVKSLAAVEVVIQKSIGYVEQKDEAQAEV